MSLRLEATYFNQLTQYFEPFIEAWNLKQEIIQKNKDAHFEVFLKSNDLLNINVTYGMAASLRNIQTEVNDILRRVEEQMRLDDKILQRDDDVTVLKELTSINESQAAFRDATADRFATLNHQAIASTRAAPQDGDLHFQDHEEEADRNSFENTQSYTIINHTGLDISLMNVSQKMVIERNRGAGLTREELNSRKEAQIIDITCEEPDAGRRDAFLVPQQ